LRRHARRPRAAVKQAEGAEGKPYGVEGQFALIDFDFTLFQGARQPAGRAEVERLARPKPEA